MDDVDLLIAGAGPVGCVIAERAATVCGWSSLIVEKRDHVAGNCHDEMHESGVMIHRYGPHYFRTNEKPLLDYLSAFTGWIEGNYRVKASVNGALYPFPINLDTLEQFFGKKLDAESAQTLLTSLASDIPQPANSEEFVLSRVGRQLYEAFYLGYTLKQWGRHPRDLEPSVCGRIPVRFTRDDRYVDAAYQVMPDKGYTAMFSAMIISPRIRTMLKTSFEDVRGKVHPRIATVYCGPLDAYFDGALGNLPWRSLAFDFRTLEQEFAQPCVQINYPNEHDYTRTVEIKHVTRQTCPRTVVSYEYPRAEGDPYYPVPAPAHRALYERYRAMADEETRTKRVYFAGRLATYRYINTDQAIEEALHTFERIREDAAHGDAVGRHARVQ
ncbi:MAG: UDP-galactopyranose mutase [Candidatus Peregrinibacteria bacterium Gr01-1014_25]|nr:MAG: UDP-galactopyranose mutase [Candidatus Peregrinibacteria bacterium Gr01-1014_25]